MFLTNIKSEELHPIPLQKVCVIHYDAKKPGRALNVVSYFDYQQTTNLKIQTHQPLFKRENVSKTSFDIFPLAFVGDLGCFLLHHCLSTFNTIGMHSGF